LLGPAEWAKPLLITKLLDSPIFSKDEALMGIAIQHAITPTTPHSTYLFSLFNKLFIIPCIHTHLQLETAKISHGAAIGQDASPRDTTKSWPYVAYVTPGSSILSRANRVSNWKYLHLEVRWSFDSQQPF
jgi:hypothetical protein